MVTTRAGDRGSRGALPAVSTVRIGLYQQFQAAGIPSTSYTKCYGSAETPIASTTTGAAPLQITYDHWDWDIYNGTDPIQWAGCWTWFDDAAFARPYTRTGPNCPGSPATYPNGTIATGFNGTTSDPRNSNVYDACAVKDIFGNIAISSYDSNPACQAANAQHDGLFYINGIWVGAFAISKDAACPMWGILLKD